MSLHSIGYLFREGLKSLWKNRTMSIASIGVLIACLLMTGVAALLTLNISATMQSVEGNNVITVYLSSDVPALTAVRIGEEIRQIDNIAECTFVPKDTALSGVMQDIDGGGTLFDSFTGDNNPLPDSYEISLADVDQVQLLQEEPEGLRRIAGTAMDNVYKGRYQSDEYDKITVCMDPQEGPWLLITMDDGTVYLVGDGAKLQKIFQNC